MKSAIGVILTFLLLAAPCFAADAGPPPVIDGYALIDAAPESEHKALARLETTIGGATLFNPENRTAYPGDYGAAVYPGHLLQTGADGVCRVVLENGDVLHVGPGTLAAFEQKADGPRATIWEGAVMIYALPSVENGKAPLAVKTAEGFLTLSSGGAGLAIEPSGGVRLLTFHETVVWTDNEGRDMETTAGQSVFHQNGKRTVARMSDKEKTAFRRRTDPELAAAREGVEAIEADDIEKAHAVFSELKQSFPYNPDAAYYLGLVYLKQERWADARSQWLEFREIAPQAAKERDIERQLMVIKMMQIKAEVAALVQQEQDFFSGGLEPNSIAVFPFINKGGDDYDVLGKGLAAMVITDLNKVPGLKVLERIKVDKLLSEIKMSQAGLVDETARVRSGRLLRAEKMIVGDYEVEQ